MPRLRFKPVPEDRNVHPIFRELDVLRIKRGMSVATLSKVSGYHMTQFECWRSGKNTPSLNAIVDVAEALGYEVTLTPKGS